jgi:crossover junction endodeoxyribonuclease RusA
MTTTGTEAAVCADKIALPWPPKVLSPNARVHWSVKSKAAKAYRAACFTLCKEAKLTVDWEGDIHVWVDYFGPDRRHRDLDNCISASKALFDGLADAIGVNDRRFRLHPYLQDGIGGMVKISVTAGPQG